jgi:hypothetical protein
LRLYQARFRRRHNGRGNGHGNAHGVDHRHVNGRGGNGHGRGHALHHGHKQSIDDVGIDRFVAEAGPGRVLAALDRITAPIALAEAAAK